MAEEPRPGESRGPAGTEPPDPHTLNPHDRIDALRGWLAQLERKLGVRTYALGAASVLALAAGIVAIVLLLGLEEDAATKSDLRALREDIGAVEESASQAAQEDVEAAVARIEELESQISSLEDELGTTRDELEVAQDDIAELRDRLSEQQGSGGAASQDGT